MVAVIELAGHFADKNNFLQSNICDITHDC